MGIKNRAYSKQRHKEWKNIANNEPYTVEILAYWNNRKEALDHELLLINCFKELGHPLTNRNNGGGGGFLGLSHTKETKQKLSNLLKNRNQESTNRCIAAFHSVESRQKAALSNKGKKKPEETKRKISIAMKKRFSTI